MSMTAQQALDSLDPKAWASTPVVDKLAVIEQIQMNLFTYAKQLGEVDAKMKNDLVGENVVSIAECMATTVMPMASTLKGIEHLYESLVHGKMPEALSVNKVNADTYVLEVFPAYKKDKLVAQKQRGFLHVTGEPKQTSPMDKPAGVIAIYGAGNYSSSIEMVMALFLENKVTVHKPHALNESTDAVWEKIFAPLIARKAVAFCKADQGREMSDLEGLHSIYFTGSTGVAHAIQSQAKAPLVSECGGNNPCIIVPGKWSDKDIERQATQLASVGKLNGGAVCGRPQTIVTSANWPQREQFLDALRKAISTQTFACSTHYPNVDDTKVEFIKNQPTAEILKPESGRLKASEFVFIPNIAEDDYAVNNEAFCQVYSEIPLNVSTDTIAFLDKATDFCNNKLLGSLGCMILIDNTTMKAHQSSLNKAIANLNYGGIAVNDVPPNIWLNAYLTWSGCGETKEDFVSGVGNFGNAFNFENVKKSVILNDFNATSFELTNRRATERLLENVSYFSIDQSWGRFAKLVGQMMVDGFKKKDF
ncbi:aldehyde dehydrogenase family protein [Endozoicomonas sp. G2_1]|uniref:aldehyde dehydrogenase family protein n=1 Tax=Endozoicomonas sp. G2_1 TaxID=2821091 RepID=UPI001ADBA3C0|nr:aldehyde dehydrogenase family protein [Endozoicomonas sp. G2_1]MBO9490367.1 aldehyde dehydrogenase family protein [Endozoicomonas sp. G2_1]